MVRANEILAYAALEHGGTITRLLIFFFMKIKNEYL